MGRRDGAQVESYLVRQRNVLVLYTDFSPIVADLHLHMMSQGLAYDPLARQILADGLCALGLHLSTRPADEYVGWTVQIHEPLMNLFFTGDARTGCVTGRVFMDSDDLREHEESVFFSQSKREFSEPQLSSLPVTGIDMYGIVEQYYQKSEQKPARYFHQEPLAAFAVALPDADREWLERATEKEVFRLPGLSGVEYLAERYIRFRCGCDSKKVTGILVGAYGSAPEALFREEAAVDVECPRCGARIRVSRKEFDRVLGEQGSEPR